MPLRYILALFVFGFMASCVAAALFYIYSMKAIFRRHERVSKRLAELGFSPLPPDEARLHHYTHERSHAGFCIEDAYAADWRGQSLRIARYSVDTDRETHFMIEVAAELPSGGPTFDLRRHPPLPSFRFYITLPPKPISILNNRRFDKRWLLETTDIEGALRFFTPALLDWLAHASSRERGWKCDGRWLSCTTKCSFYPRDIEPVLGRLAGALARKG